jgi:multiple sugar transport system permease protein
MVGSNRQGGDSMKLKLRKRFINKFASHVEAYSFLFLFFAFYIVFTLYPVVQGFIVSLSKWNITGAKTYVGFKNYNALIQDSIFWSSLWNSGKFVLMAVPTIMFTSFLFALLIDSKFTKAKAFFRSTFFMPVILSVSIIAIIWSYAFDPYTGSINTILKAIGFTEPIFWITDAKLVWVSITMLTIWWTMGTSMILYLAGLQDIPTDHYEAAEIDGANGWQQIWHITIPALSRVHTLIMFLLITASFKVFGQVFLITKGGPSGASRTLIQYIYEIGFMRFDMGRASAASYILFVVVLLITLVQFQIMRRIQRGEGDQSR